MIPKSCIREWRDYAPWLFDEQIEQDLILSRIIVEIFNVPELASSFAFRGGTALQKIYLDENFRYSEDIDLVQVNCVKVLILGWVIQVGSKMKVDSPYTINL